MDNDTRFSEAFCKTLVDEGIESVKIAPATPNMNAYIERSMRSIKEDCLNRMIFFGQDSLRKAVTEYLIHYHEERNHQGLDNQLIIPFDKSQDITKPIETTERLGGMLKSYRRAT